MTAEEALPTIRGSVGAGGRSAGYSGRVSRDSQSGCYMLHLEFSYTPPRKPPSIASLRFSSDPYSYTYSSGISLSHRSSPEPSRVTRTDRLPLNGLGQRKMRQKAERHIRPYLTLLPRTRIRSKYSRRRSRY